jgi:hypothetical protein
MLEIDDLVDDPDEFTWQSLATCRNLPKELITARPPMMDIMFDAYEADPLVALQADQMCLGCPVIKQCLIDGVSDKQWGLRGGIYLENGKTIKARNLHKTPEVWEELRRKHGRNVRV